MYTHWKYNTCPTFFDISMFDYRTHTISCNMQLSKCMLVLLIPVMSNMTVWQYFCHIVITGKILKQNQILFWEDMLEDVFRTLTNIKGEAICRDRSQVFSHLLYLQNTSS